MGNIFLINFLRKSHVGQAYSLTIFDTQSLAGYPSSRISTNRDRVRENPPDQTLGRWDVLVATQNVVRIVALL